jgi:hypothetical protein
VGVGSVTQRRRSGHTDTHTSFSERPEGEVVEDIAHARLLVLYTTIHLWRTRGATKSKTRAEGRLCGVDE